MGELVTTTSTPPPQFCSDRGFCRRVVGDFSNNRLQAIEHCFGASVAAAMTALAFETYLSRDMVVGAMVEGNYQGRNKWFLCKIHRDHGTARHGT